MGYPHNGTASISTADPTTIVETRGDAEYRPNQIVLDATGATGAVNVILYDEPDGTATADLSDELIRVHVADNESVTIDGLELAVENDVVAEAQSIPTNPINAYVDGVEDAG